MRLAAWIILGADMLGASATMLEKAVAYAKLNVSSSAG